jgi:hypothetical protein
MQPYGMWGCMSLVKTDVSENISPHFQCGKISELGTALAVTIGLLVTANSVPSSLILSTLKMQAASSSETSVLTKATQHHISEDDILDSHRCENLKSYIDLFPSSDNGETPTLLGLLQFAVFNQLPQIAVSSL